MQTTRHRCRDLPYKHVHAILTTELWERGKKLDIGWEHIISAGIEAIEKQQRKQSKAAA